MLDFMHRSSQTDYLVPTSSFIVGIGSLLNFLGDYFEYNQSHTPKQADRRALENDWAMVGQDIQAAIEIETGAGQCQPDRYVQEK